MTRIVKTHKQITNIKYFTTNNNVAHYCIKNATLCYVTRVPNAQSVWKAVVDVPCNLQRVVIILQRVVDINQ